MDKFMIEQVPAEVLEAFTSGLPIQDAGMITVESTGNGLINHSYKVAFGQKPGFFLQRFNKNVFRDPRAVQENYIHLWEYAEFEFTGIRMPRPLNHSAGESLFRDKQGDYWRAFEFIREGSSIAIPQTASRAKATAKAFARFTAAFEEFNTNLLKEVIPGFHDLGLRFSQFEESLSNGLPEKLAASAHLTDELIKRERYRHFYDIITESGEFPLRVMHHDAKIGNILFHHQTGRVICPVDYDTVMPGYFFSDLGDMVRSMAGDREENSNSPGGINIRPDFYEAILAGYTAVLGKQFSTSEKKYLHSAGLLMIYMQALRFLTDYHTGDKYYQTDHERQNLERAENQFSLLKALEEFLVRKYTFSI